MDWWQSNKTAVFIGTIAFVAVLGVDVFAGYGVFTTPQLWVPFGVVMGLLMSGLAYALDDDQAGDSDSTNSF
jgi:hypothetical protein